MKILTSKWSMTNHYLEQVNSESVNNGVFMNQVKIILAGVVVKHRNCNTEQACSASTLFTLLICVYSVTLFFREREGISKLRQHLGLSKKAIKGSCLV